MEITEAAYAEAQMEIERLRTALENLRRELDRAWKEVDAIARERDKAQNDLMAAHNAVAYMMIRQSIATGHGDTVADMVAALEPHIVALRKVVDAFKELHANAEEWECDGLGLFAQHGWWEAVDEALDALKETP